MPQQKQNDRSENSGVFDERSVANDVNVNPRNSTPIDKDVEEQRHVLANVVSQLDEHNESCSQETMNSASKDELSLSSSKGIHLGEEVIPAAACTQATLLHNGEIQQQIISWGGKKDNFVAIPLDQEEVMDVKVLKNTWVDDSIQWSKYLLNEGSTLVLVIEGLDWKDDCVYKVDRLFRAHPSLIFLYNTIIS